MDVKIQCQYMYIIVDMEVTPVYKCSTVFLLVIKTLVSLSRVLISGSI